MAKVTARLDKLALWYDYTIVCEDIKNIIVHLEEKGWNGAELVQGQLELTNPIEYTREELLKKYNGATKISRWAHTYTEDGQEAMAVVIE